MDAPKTASLTVPPSRVWNMCMLAHVDHGKSALSDALVSSNGIISARQAGHVRYLDSRADEQRRGITMKSSSIALGARAGPAAPLRVVNLVDSPGHCDFSGEVDAALRVCDGAVLVVDVVEGVCVQTVTVLRAALEHAVRPVLVLNKLDRLFVELQLDPMEAYHHIQRVLEQVNVIMGVRQVEDMMARAAVRDTAPRATPDAAADTGGHAGHHPSVWSVDTGDDVDDDDDDADGNVSGYFSPERGNVAFASATDGWAFRVNEFAAIFSAKFGISEEVLRKTLWGDFYLHAKSKRIVRKKRRADVSHSAKPMFVQFVLTNLHAVYDAVYSTKNDHDLAVEKRRKIVDKLGLSITTRDLKHKEAAVALRAIMSAWLPASKALMALITDRLPSAADAQRDTARLSVLWPHDAQSVKTGVPPSMAQRQLTSIKEGDSSPDAPVIGYVTKMLEPVSDASASGGRMNIRMPKPRGAKSEVGQQSEAPNSSRAPSDEVDDDVGVSGDGLVAFARLVSGTLSVGDKVFVYGPRYAVMPDGSYDSSTVSEGIVMSLFLLMGRDMENVGSVTAGSIVGIGGLGDCILKTATISSLPPGECLPVASRLTGKRLGVANDAVVRVSVEPNLPSDTPALKEGLRKLNQADPAVDTYVTSRGEHVIAASGELHLERCLLDLRERFAPDVQFHVSPPIIAFRETVLGDASIQEIANLHEGFRLNTTGPQAGRKAVASQQESKHSKEVSEGGKLSVLDQRMHSNTTEQTDQGTNTRTNESGSAGDPFAEWSVKLDEGRETPGASGLLASSHIRRGRFVRVGNSETLSFRLCVAPLPARVSSVLDEAGALFRNSAMPAGEDFVNSDSTVEGLAEQLASAAKQDADNGAMSGSESAKFTKFWCDHVLKQTWSSGPRQMGSNLLVGVSQPSLIRTSALHECLKKSVKSVDLEKGSDAAPENAQDSTVQSIEYERSVREVERAIVTGFQLAVQSGPLCEEPMHGTCVLVDEIRFSERFEGKKALPLPSTAAGVVIGSTREAIRLAYLNANPRLMEAALRVQVAVPGDALGRTYTVLAKRRGRVLAEGMKEGVSVFNIDAILPLTESFGFADSLRKQTSGFASAQMVFSHWEVIEADPFWVPRTEEELEDIGIQDNTESKNNISKRLITSVRRRKGLSLEEKVIESAEKQRTLSRKK